MRFALVLVLLTTAQAALPQAQVQTGQLVQITLSSDTPTIYVGDPLTLRMVITNLSDKPLQSDWVYDDDGLDTSFIYDIRSGDGKSVAKLPAKLVSGNAHFGDLAPHKAENRAAGNIERYFDISKPGVYTIVVSQFGVKSNAITVAVKPKSDQVK